MGKDIVVFLEVLEWFDPSGREAAHRLPRRGSGEFKLGPRVIVRDSQAAVFYRGGVACDALGPGRHTLVTKNVPLLTRFVGESSSLVLAPYSAEQRAAGRGVRYFPFRESELSRPGDSGAQPRRAASPGRLVPDASPRVGAPALPALVAGLQAPTPDLPEARAAREPFPPGDPVRTRPLRGALRGRAGARTRRRGGSGAGHVAGRALRRAAPGEVSRPRPARPRPACPSRLPPVSPPPNRMGGGAHGHGAAGGGCGTRQPAVAPPVPGSAGVARGAMGAG